MASRYSALSDERDEVVDTDAILDADADEDESEAGDSGKSARSDDFNTAARQRLRDELSSQVEAFLARGGKIREIPSNLNNNRPSKAVSDFESL